MSDLSAIRIPACARERHEGMKTAIRTAMDVLHSMAQRTTVLSLDGHEHLDAIDAASMRGLSGGVVYDALLLACARKVNAKRIYTWNLRHFRAVAPDLAERIVTPEG